MAHDSDQRSCHWPSGPVPPPGQKHGDRFRLDALDAELALGPGMDRDALLGAMEGHVLDQGERIGLDGR